MIELLIALAITPTEPFKLCHSIDPPGTYAPVIVDSSEKAHNHFGLQHQTGRDIIPPFAYQDTVYQQNWNRSTRAFYDNNCQPVPLPPQPAPTPTPPPPTPIAQPLTKTPPPAAVKRRTKWRIIRRTRCTITIRKGHKTRTLRLIPCHRTHPIFAG